MFSKSSRYKKLEDVVVVDRDGKRSASKALRLIPEVDGEFLHTVEETDRLDHLAYKYYKQPRKWWRICDANPDYPFPSALLGKDVMVVEQFPLIIDHEEDEPLWPDVLADFTGLVGVEHVRLVKEEVDLVERIETVGTDTVTLIVPLYRYWMIVRYNGMNLDSKQLMDRMTGLGLTVGPPEIVGRVGKSIVIPPNTVV
ncbi:MAG TPA: hypothetical protein PKD12_02205 [Nitrospira sp.]|nr:hypothetical protein [Nitrospira sp.]